MFFLLSSIVVAIIICEISLIRLICGSDNLPLYANLPPTQNNFEIPHSTFEIIPYFCGVNSSFAGCTSCKEFHGTEHQYYRRINHSIFYVYDHQLHQVTGCFIAG